MGNPAYAGIARGAFRLTQGAIKYGPEIYDLVSGATKAYKESKKKKNSNAKSIMKAASNIVTSSLNHATNHYLGKPVTDLRGILKQLQSAKNVKHKEHHMNKIAMVKQAIKQS